MTRSIEQLVEAINEGQVEDLDTFEYHLLKDFISVISKPLKKFESGREQLKKSTPVGQVFVYRGHKYEVAKFRTITDWKSAYSIAFSMLAGDQKEAMEHTMETELKKDSYTARLVTSA